MEELQLVPDENKVLRYLHEQCKKIVGDSHPDINSVKDMVDMCSLMNMMNFITTFKSPKHAQIACKGLLGKGLVKEYIGKDGSPCLVPITRTSIKECTTREFTQKDIY